ncbi:MAG TPA: TonB family protein [Acidobacteriaceae bacterium]|jgi:protein TonB|nr:TonB family protein [Acidobacteriaceae bacterium]
MSSGTKAAPRFDDSADNPLGWRVANALAIAAPYLLAAALFAVLYLQPAAPRPQSAPSPSPAPVADPSAPIEPTAAPAPAPAPPSAMRAAAAPASAKSAAQTVPGPAASVLTTPASANPPASTKQPPLPTQPVPVDPVIAETMKLTAPPPVYPPAASSANIQGTVVLAATIGADGAVQSVQPVSGPALLEFAALTAVRSWRYRPWRVYGKPVAFQTQIAIIFKLGDPPQ